MDRGQRLEVQASRLSPWGRTTGVTGVVWEIWIDLGRGVGLVLVAAKIKILKINSQGFN